METEYIGNMIAYERNRRGLTAEVVHRGICEQSVYSRIENGNYTGDIHLVMAVLGRLGISGSNDDWMILENLMRKHVLSKHKESFSQIKLFLTDVDGTLTDGGMYYGESSEELKKFNTRDGMGLQLLQEAGIKTGIITSENTKIVENRAKKLKVDYLVQGKRDGGKLAAAQDLCAQLNITLNEVAYIGDDVNCKELLSAVRVKACPADSMPSIIEIQGIHLMKKKGGEGCVREFAEMILS